MTARMTRKICWLLSCLLALTLAATSNAVAAAPWFNPGGLEPIPLGNHNQDRNWERDREHRHRLYREQRFIIHLYQGFLKRQPSSAEVREWTQKLGRGSDPTELVQAFMNSDEYFIRQTYLGLLGREPDAGGMDEYARALQNGRSRADVVESILSSEEFGRRLR
jgi:hypothetical protein